MKIHHEGIDYVVKMNSARLILFKNQPYCVCCFRTGNTFFLEKDLWSNISPHLNFYHRDIGGKIILMTKDHILPRSLGGKNHQSNYQTMCYKCNEAKDNRNISVQELRKEIGI